jgi:hypothetical protein
MLILIGKNWCTCLYTGGGIYSTVINCNFSTKEQHKHPAGMSNVSNRVMSMKFMQKSNPNIEIAQEKPQIHPSKDQSEWVLPQTSKLLRRKAPVVQTVGYSSINSFASFNDEDMPLPTRRIFKGESTDSSKTQSGNLTPDTKSEVEVSIQLHLLLDFHY